MGCESLAVAVGTPLVIFAFLGGLALLAKWSR